MCISSDSGTVWSIFIIRIKREKHALVIKGVIYLDYRFLFINVGHSFAKEL